MGHLRTFDTGSGMSRFPFNSGHALLRSRCLLSANSTPNRAQKTPVGRTLTRLVLIVLDVRGAIALLRRLKLHYLR